MMIHHGPRKHLSVPFQYSEEPYRQEEKVPPPEDKVNLGNQVKPINSHLEKSIAQDLIVDDVQGKDAEGVKSGLFPSPSVLEVGTAGNLRRKVGLVIIIY